VSETEIAVAESLMARLGLSDKMREFSINVFRKAKDGKVPIDDYLAQTGKLIGFDPTVAQSFLGGLFEMARAEDGKMSELQARILLRGEECLRLPHGTVQSWVKGGYAPPADDPDGAAISLDESYHALDVSKTATDAEVKAAYRKKCAGFHPDKIQSKGLPPEFTTFANDQLARINQAHDLIRKARGLS
jgi:DnaJ like chaperone protein